MATAAEDRHLARVAVTGRTAASTALARRWSTATGCARARLCRSCLVAVATLLLLLSLSAGCAASPPPPAPGQQTAAPRPLARIFGTEAPAARRQHQRQQRDHGWWPSYQEDRLNAANVTVRAGHTAVLDCKLSRLEDEVVSWVFRQEGTDALQLLTVGLITYSADMRYMVDPQQPDNWRLLVRHAAPRDQGHYQCHVSAPPPRAAHSYLLVQAPEVTIVDEQGQPVHDKYCEAESTLRLSCLVRHVSMTTSEVTWLRGDHVLNNDTMRGGISVRTDLSSEGASSWLSVARVGASDGGDYTCSISPTEAATVAVHILSGHPILASHPPLRWGRVCGAFLPTSIGLPLPPCTASPPHRHAHGSTIRAGDRSLHCWSDHRRFALYNLNIR